MVPVMPLALMTGLCGHLYRISLYAWHLPTTQRQIPLTCLKIPEKQILTVLSQTELHWVRITLLCLEEC